ncbi:hypothetical protein SAMN04489717_1592 [Actinopolymorpha singaporensis]|uniref:Uncharacterized protein n=1 Tax=Actinopolymorpha singaporensis TaxID=117157 RepID=A0A1H1PCM4_9ACTN|nr:hypothetical protein SAMN04489717_1592 [Actinopolymorpha singaporensis]
MFSIDELAACVDADLRALSDRWSVEIVTTEGVPDQVRETAASHGLSIPELFPQAVSVRHDGFPYSRLTLSSGPDEGGEQLEASIEQLKTFVAEVTTEEWPGCPHHRHALVPTYEDGSLGWACPSSHEVLVPLGGLSQL